MDNDFTGIMNYLVSRGAIKLKKSVPVIRINNARNILFQCMKAVMGDGVQWLPCYDKIAEWLTDNKGKGLYCVGGCGRGKTELTQRILPILIAKFGVFEQDGTPIRNPFPRAYNALDLMDVDKFSEMQYCRFLSIDDVGVESDSMNYGERRRGFVEIVDKAEKEGKLLLISSNYDIQGLKQRYEDDRVIDRLCVLTKFVDFGTESLRRYGE